MDIRFYITLLLRRIHYVILPTLLGAAAGLTFALILPPRYVAEARLVVESEQIPGDLAASTVRTNTSEQLQIIRQRILARDRVLDMANTFDIYRSREGAALSPDEIVSDMRSRIDIGISGSGRRGRSETTFVDVRFASANRRQSADVANELVTQILEANVEMRTTVSGQTLDFFEREVQRLDQELAERSARVVSFQEENRGALPDSLEFRRNQLIASQERLLDTEREITALRDRRQGLEDMFAATGSIGAQNSADMTPEERELARLQERYTSSSTVLSDSNPRMRVMRNQISALEQVVAEQSGNVDENGRAQSAYEIQIADIDNQIAFQEQRKEQIETDIAELRESIDATPENEITLQTLQRDLQNVRSQYDRAVEKRAEAETGDTIEALSKGQRISVLENASAPSQPNSPDRMKIAVAGTGAGFLAGFGLFALLEFLNGSVRRSREIEDKLGVTPIAALSYIRTDREILRRRAAILASGLVAVVVIPASLWAFDAHVMPLNVVLDRVIDKLPEIPGLTAPEGTI